jgi:protein-S-isoprenylcysteine O-methyltransferase Ste14
LRESGILHTPLGQAIVVPFPTLALCILIGMLRRMQKEDELLKETFGGEWEKWAGRVRWKLIPYVY